MTISLRPAALLLVTFMVAACGDSTAPVQDPPSQYIAVRRAWLPGERAAAIARIQASGGFGIISDYAAQVYADTDSVTTIAANPDFGVLAANDAGLVMEPRFALSWDIAGFDLVYININPVPNDTTHWIGIFWSNPAEPDWKGFAYGAAGLSTNTTVPRTDVNTTAFDASGGKTGAGGGEFRASTSTYWQGNGPIAGANNDMQITVASYGAASTITSGPYTGGTIQSGSMQGRFQKVTMTRIQGTTAPNPMTVDYDFRGVPIGAARIECVFNTPCTTNVPILMNQMRQSYQHPLPSLRRD